MWYDVEVIAAQQLDEDTVWAALQLNDIEGDVTSVTLRIPSDKEHVAARWFFRKRVIGFAHLIPGDLPLDEEFPKRFAGAMKGLRFRADLEPKEHGPGLSDLIESRPLD